ncbi:hypothetical protein MGG_17310 [Pyricularia oryzae 70-15]|uniref:Uncharacterized protein n=1 Tax=Pyricularia oryzae (strain 70-15 / ATCC MYA-4617 / FGSC 8958) TaxID=242507 RepID=G4NBY6_PYRO7|nr:uncharacterized protein MGG_17310 [Pyricularia oryzae 70-15]EHA48188.1 hypothetical protein MGG_17310 [Pyricularia oryzae 70-15]
MRREGGCWAVLTCYAFQKSHRHGCLIVGALGASKGRELNLAKCSTEYVQYAHAKPILPASEKVNYLVNTTRRCSLNVSQPPVDPESVGARLLFTSFTSDNQGLSKR